MFNLGLCSVALRHLEPEKVIEVAIASGVKGIEWEARRHVKPGEIDTAKRVGDLTRAAGLEVVSYGAYARAGALGCHEEFENCLLSAKALGAPLIRVWAGGPDRKLEDHSEADWQTTASDLQHMCSRAKSIGVDISLEYHTDTLTHGPKAAMRLIGMVGMENLFLHWQPDYGEVLPDAVAGLKAVAKNVSHLHVFNWTKARERRPLSDAADYWRTLLAAATTPTKFGKPRYAFIEFVVDDLPENVRADLQVFRELLLASDGSDRLRRQGLSAEASGAK